MCVHAHVCNIYVHICIYIQTNMSIHIFSLILYIVNESEPYAFLHRTTYSIITKKYGLSSTQKRFSFILLQ
jgi:hypothetical protein